EGGGRGGGEGVGNGKGGGQEHGHRRYLPGREKRGEVRTLPPREKVEEPPFAIPVIVESRESLKNCWSSSSFKIPSSPGRFPLRTSSGCASGFRMCRSITRPIRPRPRLASGGQTSPLRGR